MKTIFKCGLLVLAFAPILTIYGQEQTEAEYHARLTYRHTEAIEHARAIEQSVGLSRAEELEHLKGLEDNFDKALKAEQSLRKYETEKNRAIYQEIERYHTTAQSNLKALKQQFSKKHPDEVSIHDTASKIHSALLNAEVEHRKVSE